MNAIIHKLAIRISEGFQTTESLTAKPFNMFHRQVAQHQSSDLSFINGISETGLRSSAYVPGNKLIANYGQLSYAARQHLAFVLHTDSHTKGKNGTSISNVYSHIQAIQSCGFFQLIARNLEEEIYLTLAAHKIAELSLIPGMIISDYETDKDEGTLPSMDKIIDFLGNPDDKISSPTPAQIMLFGKTRRRIPNWYSLDLPALLASGKDGQAISFETVANEQFFYRHLQEIIIQVFSEIESIFQFSLKTIQTFGKKAKNGIILLGGSREAIGDNFLPGLNKTECTQIVQLNPFPANAVAEFCRDKHAITLLEPVSGQFDKHTFLYGELSALINNKKTKIYRAKYQDQLHQEKIRWAHDHMLSNSKVLDYFVGLEFTRKSSLYPKQEVLLQDILANYPTIEQEAIGHNDEIIAASNLKPAEMPLALRQIKDKGPKYAQLSRYNDQTALLYAKGERKNLVADPYSALALVPQAGSALFNSNQTKDTFPVLDASLCTGCGACFSYCPQLAVHPIVHTVEALMKAGMNLAVSKGSKLSRLTPMVKNMGKIAGPIFAESEGSTAIDLLPEVFKNLCDQMKITGDSLAELQAEFNTVMNEIGEMPIACTDSFFFTPNAHEKGSGEIFSLSFDPYLCNACGLCAEICEDGAITMEAINEHLLAKAKNQYALWETLPDVSPETVARLFQDEDYSKAAALLLSKNYAQTLVGVNEDRNADPVKQMMHIITASAESVVQPKLVAQLKQIDILIEKLSDQAHKILNEAMPNESLDILRQAISGSHDRKLSFKQVFEKFSDDGHGKLIDREDMQRKLALIESLKRFKYLLSEGPSGLGRSRFGLMIDGTERFDWASDYPMNPFLNPAVIQRDGDISEQALGLFNGQLRYLLDNIKLIRRANLEIENKYNPSLHDKLIANLSWENLTEEEKKTIPPILLIVDQDQLLDHAWSGLFRLLTSDYPLKVFALDSLSFDYNKPVTSYNRMNASIWSIIGLKKVYVYQGSLANADSLCSSVMNGLNRIAPAFFHLYVTNPQLYHSDETNWMPYYDLACMTRSFPDFLFDPKGGNAYLHGAIVLNENPDNKENWATTNIEEEDGKITEYKVSWADWIFTYSSWRSEFRLLEEQENFILLSEYLESDEVTKKNHVPVIARRGNKAMQYYAVSEKVVQMTQEVQNNWRNLQEFAGLISPFAESLRKELTAASELVFEAKLEKLKKKHAEELKNFEVEHLEKIRQQLKQKLVKLSKMAKN